MAFFFLTLNYCSSHFLICLSLECLGTAIPENAYDINLTLFILKKWTFRKSICNTYVWPKSWIQNVSRTQAISWLELHASTAQGMGLIPGQGTEELKNPHPPTTTKKRELMSSNHKKDNLEWQKKKKKKNPPKTKKSTSPWEEYFTKEGIQMASNHTKRYSSSSTIGKCKLKPQWDTTSLKLVELLPPNLTTRQSKCWGACEKPSSIAGRGAEMLDHTGELFCHFS